MDVSWGGEGLPGGFAGKVRIIFGRGGGMYFALK